MIDFRQKSAPLNSCTNRLTAGAQRNNIFLIELLDSNLIHVNSIKNFLNQTLLHFACENNDLHLCNALLNYGADCLAEDNYRQTPFIICAKRNYVDLLKLFTAYLKTNIVIANLKLDDHLYKQIRNACSHACNHGNLEIVRYLFEVFDLHSENLLQSSAAVAENINNFELNVLHVACYKAQFEIAKFLIDKAKNVVTFINSPINQFRNSTALEETLKGYLTVDFETTQQEKVESIDKYQSIINILIQNQGKFSKNFIQSNGLSKMLSQTFSGPRKDIDFLHFLGCFSYLFKFKLNEMFFYPNLDKCMQSPEALLSKLLSDCEAGEHLKPMTESAGDDFLQMSCKLFDMERTIDEFLLKIYLISQRVIKDHKRACLNKFIEIVYNLHYSGQLPIKMSKLAYMKEKNMEIYKLIDESVKSPMSLKELSVIAIRQSIACFGRDKINLLTVPQSLKQDLFLNDIPIIKKVQSSYFTYLF